MKNYKKGFGSIEFLVSMFIILMTFSVWYYIVIGPTDRMYQVVNEQVSVATSTEGVALRKITSTTDTSTWKTYKDEEFGFEFKYPTDTKVVKNEQYGWTEFTFDFEENLTNLIEKHAFLGTYKNQKCPMLVGGNGAKAVVENVDIGGVPFLYQNAFSNWATDKTESFSFLTQKGADCVGVEFRLESFDNKTEMLPGGKVVVHKPSYDPEIESQLFINIISTFKFTDPTSETSDWKTYRNEEYGFEFQYPARLGDADDDQVDHVKNLNCNDNNVNKDSSGAQIELFTHFRINLVCPSASDLIQAIPDRVIATVGGRPALYFDSVSETKSFYSQDVIIKKLYVELSNGYFILITNSHVESIYSSPFDMTSDDFEKIISTFKFTN